MLFIGDDSDNCQSSNSSGNWTYNGDDTITVDIAGQSSVLKLSFSNNNSAMELTQEIESKIIIQTYKKQ